MKEFIKPVVFVLLIGILYIFVIKLKMLFPSDYVIPKNEGIDSLFLLCSVVLFVLLDKFLINFNIFIVGIKMFFIYILLILIVLYLRFICYSYNYTEINSININWFIDVNLLLYLIFPIDYIWKYTYNQKPSTKT